MACVKCEALERDYQRTVRHINVVVETTYVTLTEKLHRLHRWQERRDAAIEGLYRHKREHTKIVRRDEDIGAA